MDKVKTIKIVRELIAGALVVLMYNLHPELLTWNYVILTSLLFGATLGREDSSWKKFFGTPSVFYFGITLVMISGFVSSPLTIEFVILIGVLAGVKEAKGVISRLTKSRLPKEEPKSIDAP